MQFDGTRVTVWLAVLAYVVSLAMGWARRRGSNHSDRRAEQWQRALWTAGCLLTVVHVLFAFAEYHHWSHRAAYAHTAQVTAEKVGVAWGGGLYFNYLFLLIWTADVVWWWCWRDAYVARPRGIAWFVHLYLAFIVFNATVVFGAAPIRYATLVAVPVVGLAVFWVRLREPPG
ncbi:MAG: hypothetical protein JSS02_33650 [Planctomycetes bacterium]|nr:hypothetical protein [Planctomycetota bacterium]